MENPLIGRNIPPRYDRIRPVHVNAAMRRMIRDGDQAVRLITKDLKPATWDNTMAPLERLVAQVSETWGQVEHMCAVMATPQWQKRHMEWSVRLAEFFDRIGQNQSLYERCHALRNSSSFANLTSTRRKIVEDTVRDFELAGVALAPSKQNRFRACSARLAELSSQFGKNLLDATNDFALWVDSEHGLEDLPADVIREARENARRHGGKGLRFTLLMSSYIPFMKHCGMRDLRAKMHRAYMTRASDLDMNDINNCPVIREIRRLRHEQARLLGFSDFVEMAMQKRMAGSYEEVRSFLLSLAAKARPHAQRELDELGRFAKSHFGMARLEPWDHAYVAERMRQHLYVYSDNAVRKYFPKSRVIKGLADALKRLFGIHLNPGTAPLWHKDVSFWKVESARGKRLGGLYIDLHAREAKRSGAWMADVVSRRKENGKTLLPTCHMVCNFAPPAPGGESLLSLDEVVTLFHEAGHALHHLLTEIDDYSASGINGVEWDAVELPSQYLENYAWRKDVMRRLSRHSESGKALPDDLYGKIVASRKFLGAMRIIRQIELALFDLELHHRSGVRKDVRTILRDVRRRVCVVRHPGYDRFHCGFGHLFGGGYAAGYYSYLWAEVLAADAFEQAERIIAKTGRYSAAGLPFKRSILAAGSSRPMMKSYHQLTGRKPKIDPLLRSYGLI